MAYPTINGPYGLRPINLIGGQVFAGSTRKDRFYFRYDVLWRYYPFHRHDNQSDR